MGYKAAVQILKQAEDLKEKVSRNNDLLNSSTLWTDQQKLQTIYHQVLVLDLEYALDKKVEQDLWNIGFKTHISNLQELAKDKKNPQRSDFQALLTWSLESASGFYLTLLQELCNTFDIDLPFRRRGSVYGQTNYSNDPVNIPQISSCRYICQYCLVHLGDIARYRNQRKQAENFYKEAILVSPNSGQPYNQLALLQASQGNRLSAVFYYIRGIAVKHPFPASSTNLLSVLSSCIDKDRFSEKIQTKMTVNEFIRLFLCTHGYFHTVTELKQAEQAVKSLNSVITALIATQSFTRDKLIKLTAINLYALKHIGQVKDMTEDEKKVRELVLELIAGSFSGLLMPVHTLKTDESLPEYYALPAVKFLMYFISNEPDVLKEKVFKERLQIWPSLCKLINSNQKLLKYFNSNKYTKVPLSEDKYLQGFLPLSENLKDFDFKEEIEDAKTENLVRIKRMVDFCVWLSEFDCNGSKLITKVDVAGIVNFEPSCSQPDPTNDLLEELKHFSVAEQPLQKNAPEKKTGILKPQGSLEKSREERDITALNDGSIETKSVEASKNQRVKQNVALQSIYKKIEETGKQVKFNVDETDKDKLSIFDALKPPQPPKPTNQQFNMGLRTQSFNENHPAFPVTTPPSDYLTNLRNIPIDNYKSKETQMMPQFAQNHAFLPPNKTQSFPSNQSAPQKIPGNYQSVPNNQSVQTSYQVTPNNQSAQSSFSNNRPSFPVPPPPFPNTWNREEIPPYHAQNNWWLNATSQNQPSFPRQEQNFGVNFTQYPNYNMPQKPNSQYDMFGSPWGNISRPTFGNEGFETNQSMSMRQAMLNEAGPAVRTAPQNVTGQVQSQPSQGYSLFNNSWTPSLPGQFQANKASENARNVHQHTLFGGHGPSSLAQLLEHQQNQMNKNDT